MYSGIVFLIIGDDWHPLVKMYYGLHLLIEGCSFILHNCCYPGCLYFYGTFSHTRPSDLSAVGTTGVLVCSFREGKINYKGKFFEMNNAFQSESQREASYNEKWIAENNEHTESSSHYHHASQPLVASAILNAIVYGDRLVLYYRVMLIYMEYKDIENFWSTGGYIPGHPKVISESDDYILVYWNVQHKIKCIA